MRSVSELPNPPHAAEDESRVNVSSPESRVHPARGQSSERALHATEAAEGAMGSAASTAVHLTGRNRKTNALLLRYGDAKGELQEKFKTMKVSPDMRLSWLERWQLMDDDGSKLLDYTEFLQACGLPDSMWSWRMFNLLDKNFVGCVDFFTFFSSLPRFLVYDRMNAIEVTFRMCSRRGATWDPKQSVLDEKDIRLFVEDRYPTLDRKHALHRSLEILAHLDDDCSGGVSFEEFHQFCDMNPIFLTAVQHTLQALRNALFGEAFWKQFTRMARTFDKSTKSEIFCMSQADPGDSDTNTGGFAAATTRRVAVATKRRFGALTAAAVNKNRQKMDEMGSLAHATGGNLRKVMSESNLRRRVKSTDTGAISNAGGVMVKTLKLWTTTAPSDIASKPRSLTARAGEAKATLRRILSDSDLRSFGKSERLRLPKLSVQLNEDQTGGRARLTKSFSLAGISSALTYAEATRNKGTQMSKAAKVGGARALAALKRSVRAITAVRYFSKASPERGGPLRREQQSTGSADVTPSTVQTTATARQGARNIEEDEGECRDKDTNSEEAEGGRQDEKVDTTEKEPGTLTDAQAKIQTKLLEERHWAATEKFYAHLVTATERLEAKKSPEKGYDFSADFPKLWCAAHAHGSQGQKEVENRRQRWSSASKRVANVYLRFITLWQEAGEDSGRSKLSKAFNRWRLNTCDATMYERGSFSTLSRGGTVRTGTGAGQCDFSTDALSHPARRVLSLQEMWETVAAEGECGGDKCDLHKIIMNQARADRLLPWELCEAYGREMVERIDRRQQENNVPLLPMPFY